MPLFGAERSRIYREKMKQNPAKYQEYLQLERKRYGKKKEDGNVKVIGDVSKRERRRRRRYWREMKKKQPLVPPSPSSSSHLTEKKKLGRKRVKREKSRTYRKMQNLEEQLNIQNNEKLRKRLYRANQKHIDPNSPRTKVKLIFKGPNSAEKANKMLLFHNVLLEGIKKKYKLNKSEKTKQLITKGVLCNQLLKKYRLQKYAKTSLEITQRRIKVADQNFSLTRKTQKTLK
ncbi:hypothetical protein DPMN_190656 [Dreissena polymorpha]|uniref:Uncharacterized protein n=1 Tax=Dreissena polymorpha TaxID=45954 RepID=A0A9D3XZ88_DREPO|nr:hypothetical protein DPMN_190656 [Dreissena polymorpha]